MAIAQGHVDKEQCRQAELYNRRVEGSFITAGDRVLVSNKRERVKRKTADRWESTVYTVVSVNASTHTYRIRNPATGQERVVHRNLLMLVNFLPVDGESLSDHTFVSSYGDESGGVVDVGGLSADDEGDAGTRTLEWVGSLTTASVDGHAGGGSLGDVLSMADGPGHTDSLHPQSQMEISSGVTYSHASLAGDQSTHTHSMHSVCSGNAHCTSPPYTHSDSGTMHRVRTRVGRIVRPVNCLLCQMFGRGVLSVAS